MRNLICALGVSLLAVVACKSDAPPVDAAHPAPSASVAPVATASAAASAPVVAAAADAGGGEACAKDDECVLTTFPGCCSCCKCGFLKATTKQHDADARRQCDLVRCASCEGKMVKCVACKDPVAEGMQARCNDGRCTLVETKAR